MKEFIVRAYDDIEYAKGNKVPVEGEAVILSFNGQAVTLDLSESSIKTVTEMLRPLMDLGQPYKPLKRGQQAPGKVKHGYGTPEKHAELAAMREYADRMQIRYRTENGQYYYSKALRAEFKEYTAKKLAQGITE
jgi:hypothetical protein